MKIESSSINGSLLGQTSQMAMFSSVLSKNINKQIANLQEQLKKVTGDETLSSEEQTKMKKQLSTQIKSLTQLLEEKQTEMELKSRAMEPADRQDSENSLLQSDDTTAVSVEQMLAVMKNSASFSEVDALGAIKTNLEGTSRILSSQIDADAAHGLDTTEKAKQFADMQAKIQTISSKLAEKAAGSLQKNDRSGEGDDKDDEKDQATGTGHLDIIV